MFAAAVFEPLLHHAPEVTGIKISGSCVWAVRFFAGGLQLSSEGLDDWMLTNLEQPTLRRARVSALTKAAVPFQYPHSEVLMVIGTALSTSVK